MGVEERKLARNIHLWPLLGFPIIGAFLSSILFWRLKRDSIGKYENLNNHKIWSQGWIFAIGGYIIYFYIAWIIVLFTGSAFIENINKIAQIMFPIAFIYFGVLYLFFVIGIINASKKAATGQNNDLYPILPFSRWAWTTAYRMINFPGHYFKSTVKDWLTPLYLILIYILVLTSVLLVSKIALW